MATQFSIIIDSVPVALSEDGLTQVVKSIFWTRLASREVTIDGEVKTFTAGYPGTIQLTTPDPSTFIPYNELTESNIVQWINDNVNNWPEIDDRLELNIQSQINPPVVDLPLPWQQ